MRFFLRWSKLVCLIETIILYSFSVAPKTGRQLVICFGRDNWNLIQICWKLFHWKAMLYGLMNFSYCPPYSQKVSSPAEVFVLLVVGSQKRIPKVEWRCLFGRGTRLAYSLLRVCAKHLWSYNLPTHLIHHTSSPAVTSWRLIEYTEPLLSRAWSGSLFNSVFPTDCANTDKVPRESGENAQRWGDRRSPEVSNLIFVL